MIKVTLENLHKCFMDLYRVLYINGVAVDGLKEYEIRMLLKAGYEVFCG